MGHFRRLPVVWLLSLAVGACFTVDPAPGLNRSAQCGDLEPAAVTALLGADTRLVVTVTDLPAGAFGYRESDRLQLSIDFDGVPCAVLIHGTEIVVIAGDAHLFLRGSTRTRWLECLDYLCDKLTKAFPQIETDAWSGHGVDV